MTAKAEKRYMSRVAELGCIICKSPAEVHHIREGQGMGQRASNYLVIPLCPDHHRHGYNAFHQGKQTFERCFGSELELLAKTIEALNEV